MFVIFPKVLAYRSHRTGIGFYFDPELPDTSDIFFFTEFIMKISGKEDMHYKFSMYMDH